MKEFHSFHAMALYLELVVAEAHETAHAMEKSAKLLEKAAKEKIGEYQSAAGPFAGWAELADSTKEDRARKGFSENDPLLRTGELRDSINHRSDTASLAVGSDLDIAVYQELGTATIPPRSFLGSAAFENGEKVANIIGHHIVAALTGVQVVDGAIDLSPPRK